ncbi:hypothetical protein R0137_09700 [Congregibacter brevis]|uniref:Uncharacterized protein n=1 Tax=Congregibacter brevis TaxID=3081201 RepID=A0ABZ0I9X7_9GAMM|nr:hypothetical protein R0137_09700 [Congregibacter sp. IMCC45268]
MAKQVIGEAKAISLPELSVKELQYDFSQRRHAMAEVVVEERQLVFDDIDIERQLDDLRPDLIGYVDGNPVVIEIYVSHKCDRGKVTKLRDRGLRAVEVDLSNVRYTVTKQELEKLLLVETENKKWLSHPEAPAVKQRLRSSLREKVKRANESIQQTSSRNQNPRSAMSRHVQPRRPKAAPTPKPVKEYPSRIFFCKECRHQFSMMSTEALNTLVTVTCTACGADVSTRRV